MEGILSIDGLEIIKELHPLLHPYLFEYYKGHIMNRYPAYTSVWSGYSDLLQNAIELLKVNTPAYFEEFQSANKSIFIHNNPKILNFTSVETFGMLYFYTTPNSTLMYFVEELIHQGAHNILYAITFNKHEFFKIDAPNTIMRDLTGQEWDYRDVYGAFHGVYTVYKRLECHDILLQKIF
ncbi:MAG: hypothetical protein Q4G08_01045 [Capnocytophaga sp.]|nr:hypothetical protein [Capnocytophaga sp.]